MSIRVGIGGWTYEPWRDTFYPKGLPHARELEHAARAVTSIEVNGTFYRTQTPKTFRAWAEAVPEDFVFALKAPRYATNRRVLAEAGESIGKFVASGLAELGDKLGPINWQFAPTKAFDPDDFAAFLDLLPEAAGGLALRHAVEVRHESFCCPAFLELVRARNVAVVVADSPDYPQIADVTADLVYARLQDAKAEIETGYAAAALDDWAERARIWEKGGAPEGLRTLAPHPKSKAKNAKSAKTPRDCFLYFINGAKERAPAAAQALLARLERVS